jgi:hypothetical protein
MRRQGWRNEGWRHSLAARGIKTGKYYAKKEDLFRRRDEINKEIAEARERDKALRRSNQPWAKDMIIKNEEVLADLENKKRNNIVKINRLNYVPDADAEADKKEYYAKKYNYKEDLAAFKAKYKNRQVTQEEFRAQAKKAFKISVLGIDDGKFRPQELIIPSNKNEAEVAKAIFLRVKLREQNKKRLAKAKTPEERAKIQEQIKKNDKIEKRLRRK